MLDKHFMLSAVEVQFPTDLCLKDLPKGRFSVLLEGSFSLILYTDMTTYSNELFRNFIALRLLSFYQMRLKTVDVLSRER